MLRFKHFYFEKGPSHNNWYKMIEAINMRSDHVTCAADLAQTASLFVHLFVLINIEKGKVGTAESSVDSFERD